MLVAVSDLFGQSQQVRADLIELGGATPVRLLTGGGSDTVRLQFPSTSGELAAKPFTVSAPTGSVVRYAADPVPSGYTKCHGQNAARTQYQALYSAIGTAFGAGDGATTFTLPDAGPIPSNGLVGWWPFNGNANDESGNGFNGAVNGATSAVDRFGYNQSAYSFDGNDWIEVAHDPKLVSAAGSVSMWFRTPQLRGQNILYKVAKQTALNEAYGIGWYNTPTKNLHGAVKFNSQCKAWLGWVWAYPQETYTDNVWHHLVMTWGDGAVSVYVDGVLAAAGVSPVNPADVCNGGPVMIGGTWVETNGSYGNYQGEIDDIAIYNRIVTADERAQLFGAESSRIMSIVKY
jgi:hypothetical protein